MPLTRITVDALWDDEARVWSASSADIDGLAVEGADLDILSDHVQGAIRDLIEMNGIEAADPLPVEIVARRTEPMALAG